MLKIDCLLLNTDYIDGVRKYMKYLGADMLESGGSADFESMYKRLRKDGLELDIETAGHAYVDAFREFEGYSKAEDVYDISGREFSETARNLLLDEKEESGAGKEKQIGNLSPTQSIARRLIKAFKAEDIVDNSTKSTLRQIQDWYADTVGRMTEKEAKEPKEDARTWEEKIQQGLDKMNVGHRDVDGTILNLETLHKDVNKQLKELTNDLRAKGKDVEAAQWEQHIKNFEDAVYSIALNRKEARDIVEGALVKKGFAKVDKKGNMQIDWDKVSSHTNSLQQIRENVTSAIMEAGHPASVAERIADNLQREFVDAKEYMLQRYLNKIERAQKDRDKASVKKEPPSVESILSRAVKDWDNYRSLAERPDAPLIMSKKTAKDVLNHILKQQGLVDNAGRLSMDKLADAISNPADVRKMAKDYLVNEMGFAEEKADAAAEAMSDMYEDTVERTREYVEGVIAGVEKSWAPKEAGTKAKPITETIDARIKDLERYNKLSDTLKSTIPFRKGETKAILAEALKDSDRFGRDVAGGGRQIDWKKMGVEKPTADQMREIVESHLESLGYDVDVAERIAESISAVYPEMVDDIARHAGGLIEARAKAELRKSPERKTALGALAELNALGLFESAQQRLIDKAVNVSETTTDDLKAIKEIADAYSKANAMAGPMYGEYLQSTMERNINAIVARNQNNKTNLLRVARFMHDWFSLHNFTLIAGPYNLLQNTTSGAESIAAANIELFNQTGSKKFSDNKLWWNTLKDVAMGAPGGDASSKFGYTQAMDKLNTLNFKENPLKALGTSAVVMYRAALNGMDAANKAVIRNKAFIVNVHEALVRDGWDKKEATGFIYEMMYGQNREKVRQQAEKIVASFGKEMGVGSSEAAKKRAIDRLTDDMVKANIELGTELGYSMGASPPITPQKVEAAIKAARHGAGIALGHEANNPFSEGQTAARRAAQRKYDSYIKAGKYNRAARQALVNTVYYDGIRRLVTGGANWMVLTLEGTGLRLISAIPGYKSSKREAWNPADPKAMEQAMADHIKYQKQITRGVMGLAKAAIVLSGVAALGLAVREDEEEGALSAGFNYIDDKVGLSKTFKRLGGALGLLFYLNAVSKGKDEGAALSSAMEFMTEISNSNPVYSIPGKAVRAGQQFNRDNVGKGWGTVGTIAGDVIPGTPILPAYKKMYELGKEVFTGKPPKYDKSQMPMSFGQGFFYRGLIQDVSNQFSEEDLEWLGWENWAKKEEE